MAIAPITLGDTQSRVKINAAIEKANLVDGKADAAALAVLDIRKADRAAAADAQIGPGEYPTFWTLDIEAANSPAAVSPALAATDSDGRVIRLGSAARIGPICLTRVEPGRRYKTRFAFRRRTNSPDPANDAVRLAVRWFDQSKVPIANPAGTTIVQDLVSLTTGSGRQSATFVFAREAGAGVDLVVPAGARYGRPFVQTFGLGSVTDIEVIDCVDITDASLWSPDVADLDGRLASVESVDAGNRLDYLESVANDPEAMTLANVGALEAVSVPAGVQSVTVLSGADDGDGLGGIYRRAGGVTPIRSIDGAYWEERNPMVLEPDEPTAVAGHDARLPMSSRRVKNSIDVNAPPIAIALISQRTSYHLGYRRKLFVALPFTTVAARSLAVASGALHAYPQACAFNDDRTRIFVLYRPTGGSLTTEGDIVVAWDISNKSNPVELTTFKLNGSSFRECLVYREEGGVRYLYAGGATSPVRFDITSLPVTGDTLSAETTFTAVRSYTWMAFDGRSWFVNTGLNDMATGQSSKAQIDVWDSTFAIKLGSFWLPRMIASSYTGNLLEHLMKCQGMAALRGRLWFGAGGVYGAGDATTELDSRNQGIACFDPAGGVGEAFLCPAEQARARFASCFGASDSDLSLIENEGVTASGDKLYALWTTLNTTDYASGAALSRGIYVTEELSVESAATDFSDLAATPRGGGFDPVASSFYGWGSNGNGVLEHPLTGAALSSVQNIVSAVLDCGLTDVCVQTTGITTPITDPDGAPIGSGQYINIYQRRGFGFNVEIRGQRAWKRWWYSGGTFFDTYQEFSSFGTWLSGAKDQRGANPHAGNTQSIAISGIDGNIKISSDSKPVHHANRFGTDGALMEFRKQGAIVGSVSVTASGTAYNVSSDSRLKTRSGELTAEDAAAILRLIAIHRFTWNSTGDEAIGAFAQDLFDVYPDAVTPGVGEPGGEDFIPWGVDYSKLVPLLVVALVGLIEVRSD